MRYQLAQAFRFTLLMTVLTGLIYPGVVTGLCQLLLSRPANGSLLEVNGKIVGSTLLGQNFSKPEYFHPRPSAAGSGYDATASSGTNLGPTSAKLLHGTTKTDDKGKEVVDFDGLEDRIVHYCVDNNIPFESSTPLSEFKDAHGDLDDVKLIKAFNDPKTPLVFTPKSAIPSDAVTASASGLDPDISPASALAQAPRIAQARGIAVDQLTQFIGTHTVGRRLGFLGEPRVNVLLLNLDLNQNFPMGKP